MKMTRYLAIRYFPPPEVAYNLKLAKLAELSWFAAQQWAAEIREYNYGLNALCGQTISGVILPRSRSTLDSRRTVMLQSKFPCFNSFDHEPLHICFF